MRWMNTRGENWLLWKGPCRLICILGHNFWTNYDLDLYSISKWSSGTQFCERYLCSWQKKAKHGHKMTILSVANKYLAWNSISTWSWTWICCRSQGSCRRCSIASFIGTNFVPSWNHFSIWVDFKGANLQVFHWRTIVVFFSLIFKGKDAFLAN